MIDLLIDKQDNVEIIRDKVGTILVSELANQRVLAIAAGEDPLLWTMPVYLERSNPLEPYLNQETFPESPTVNVWIDNEVFNKDGSDVMERQRTNGVINIDCYGSGVSMDEVGAGHDPGDRRAAFDVQRAVRLVRNILMADIYTYLDLRGTVWGRWPESITYFQPEIDNVTIQNVNGARIALSVEFNELSPQAVAETLELITVDVHRAFDGLLVLEADYVYPLT